MRGVIQKTKFLSIFLMVNGDKLVLYKQCETSKDKILSAEGTLQCTGKNHCMT